MKTFLSIDLGTSGPKVSIVTVHGDIVASTYDKTTLKFLPDGGVEQSPFEWWEAIERCVGRVLKDPRVVRADIAGVACTAQWSGTVAVGRDGVPLMDAIIWMDSRGAKNIEQLMDGLIKVEGYSLPKMIKWVRRTGGAPGKSGKDPIAHILYIKQHRPEIYERTFRFLEPKDYLNFVLTGEFASSFDTMTLHWVTDNRDIHNIHYDSELLSLAGLEGAHLPEMRPATSVLAPLRHKLADAWGLKHNLPVVVSSADLQTAGVGSGAVNDFQAHLCLGTSSWLTCPVPFKKTDIFSNMATLPSALPGHYFIANEQECAGACLNFLHETFFPAVDGVDPFDLLTAAAQQAPAGSHNMIFTPWLNGERTPVENHTIRGGLHNLSLAHRREDVVRAVYEGVAYNSRWLLQCVEKMAQKKFDSISVIGGGAQSDVWCQIHADILGRTIRQIKHPRQANVRGAAWLGAIAIGAITANDIPQLVQVNQTFEPQVSHGVVYDNLFKSFLGIYKANKKLYQRMHWDGLH